MFVNLTT